MGQFAERCEMSHTPQQTPESKPTAEGVLAPSNGSAAVLRLRNEIATSEAKDSPLARDITLVCNMLSDAIYVMGKAYDLLPTGASRTEFDDLIDRYWEPPNDGSQRRVPAADATQTEIARTGTRSLH